jgi:hypothetical protein
MFKFSKHFINDVLPKRPYLTLELLEEIITNPIKTEVQNNGWIKIWGYSSKYNKFIRVILLEDCETIHTAFFDRNFNIEEK